MKHYDYSSQNGLLPMNLQLFAEGGEPNAGEPKPNTDPQAGNPDDPQPDGNGNGDGGEGGGATYETLVAQLAAMTAEVNRIKQKESKASKEAAEYRRQLQAKMTEEERKKLLDDEAEKQKDDLIADLQKQISMIESEKFWTGKDIGMDDATAHKVAEAEVNGDREEFRKCISAHVQNIRNEAYQNALKSRPEINAGNGDGDDSIAIQLAKGASQHHSSANADILNHYRR